MPDQPRKPLAALSSKVPEDVREFVRCRRDSVDIAPRTIDIPGGMSLDVSFEDGGNGSVVVRLDGPGGFLDIDIRVSVKDGHLVADTSKIPFGKEFVDKWIKDFNADLDAPPAKQLSGISVNNGKFTATKGKVVADTEATSVSVIPPPMRQPPPPRHVTDPIPPPVKVDSEIITTTSESIPDLTDLGSDVTSDVDESGFIDRPPPTDEAKALRGRLPVVVGGVVTLTVIGLFLFGNLGGDTPSVSPLSSPSVEATDSAGPETTTQVQSSDETSTTESPAAKSVSETDPVGDNGGEGSGADIVAMEFVNDGVPTVLLSMGSSPLGSTSSWYSYYLEVTFKRASGATDVVIWEKHAGLTRSGALDSSGDTDGLGVTLTDRFAEFETNADSSDPVVKICIKAFSLVDEGGVFTQDEMEVDVGS
jgi:hypothetical protein